MKWSIQELSFLARDPLFLQETLDLEEALQARCQEVLAASAVEVTGMVLYEEETVLVQLQIALTITLPSSRSLQPVEVAMQFPMKERYLPLGVTQTFGDDGQTIVLDLEGDTVDLDQAIVDNILTRIPLKRLTPDELKATQLLSGEDWNLMTEATFATNKAHQQTGDPRLAKLQELFKDQTSEN